MRWLRLGAVVPEELYAGRPAVLGVRVTNLKRRLASYSLTLEVGAERLYLDRLAAGAERLLTWETAFAARGRRRLPGVRVTTRFPFGLFLKAGRVFLDHEVIVFPAVRPLDSAARRRLAAGGPRSRHRRGRGPDRYNLREYPLMVREHEAETAVDARIVLLGDGARDPLRLEAALSEAASLAVELLRGGAAVELAGPGVHVPLGRGHGQRRRLLTALALYAPGGAPSPAPSVRGNVAEIPVTLG
jgi:uncharacterized protein (DUF58 family)